MKIGFIKFGLKTYFKENNDNQGYNHELVSIFDIFEKHGHECFMVSGSDLYNKLEDVKSLDYIFVFNGPITRSSKSADQMLMLKNYTLPYIKIINETSIPWCYFWTDPRSMYNLEGNTLFNRMPNIILSQEKNNYGHLDKIVLYNKVINTNLVKENKLTILMNEKKNKREKKAISICNWLKGDINVEIIGKWKTKNDFVKEPIPFGELGDYLSKVKYSWNQTADPFWINQKYWEMVLNNVICFYYNSDLDNLVIKESLFNRVMDEIELSEKITSLEKDNNLYLEIIKKQQDQIKPEYLDGSFLYKTIMEKINK